jgi:hypothetical protein
VHIILSLCNRFVVKSAHAVLRPLNDVVLVTIVIKNVSDYKTSLTTDFCDQWDLKIGNTNSMNRKRCCTFPFLHLLRLTHFNPIQVPLFSTVILLASHYVAIQYCYILRSVPSCGSFSTYYPGQNLQQPRGMQLNLIHCIRYLKAPVSQGFF